MSLAAYKDIRDRHEDGQDERLSVLEVNGSGSDARVEAVEGKTRHLTADNDHTKHGRRLEATDKITCDSSDSLAASSLEVIAHTLADASLVLQRSANGVSGGVSTVLATEAFDNTTTLKTNVGASTTTRTVLSVANSTGEVELGEGAAPVKFKTAAAEVAGPASSNATLSLVSGGTTNDATLAFKHAASGTGFRVQASGAGGALFTWRDISGAATLIRSIDSEGRQINLVTADGGIDIHRTGTGSIANMVKANSGTVNEQTRIDNAAQDGFDRITSTTDFKIRRVNDGAATDCLSINRATGGTTVNGDVNIQSSAPVLSLVDTDDNSDFRIRLEDGHIRFQDTTNFNRDFLVANSSGDCNIGVSGRTTACMGNFNVNGGLTVSGTSVVAGLTATTIAVNGGLTLAGTARVGSTASTSSKAALSIGSASGTKGVLFPAATQAQLNSLANGGPGGLVMYNNTTSRLSVLNSANAAFYDVITTQNSVSAKLEVWSGSVVKTTAVTGFTPTGAWQNLFTSLYPLLVVPSVLEGDIVEVRGSFAEDHGDSGYANMSSVFRYVVREGSSSGTDIGGESVSVVAGGDNNIENAQGHYYTRATVATAGSLFVGLQYKAANSVARDLVKCARGSNSSLFVTVRRAFIVAKH